MTFDLPTILAIIGAVCALLDLLGLHARISLTSVGVVLVAAAVVLG